LISGYRIKHLQCSGGPVIAARILPRSIVTVGRIANYWAIWYTNLEVGEGGLGGRKQKDSHQAKLDGCPSVVKIYPLIISLEYL
jgi:hypothetical protein